MKIGFKISHNQKPERKAMKEWMICPKAGECKEKYSPDHCIVPHLKCSGCDTTSSTCPACVPYSPKVGDRAKVIKSLSLNKDLPHLTGIKNGDIVTISVVTNDGNYQFKEGFEPEYYCWKPETVEYLPPDEPRKDNVIHTDTIREYTPDDPVIEKKASSSVYIWSSNPCPDPWIYHVQGGGDLNIYPGKMFDIVPPKPKYRWTGKALKVWEVAKDSRVASNELINLCSWAKGFGLDPRSNLFSNTEKFISYATRSYCFRRFLLAGGYIEEVPDKLEGFFG
jgi:hypothetical protein